MFTMSFVYNGIYLLYFFCVQDSEKAPPSDSQPEKPPSDTQPEKSPPPSDSQPEKSPPPSDTQSEKAPSTKPRSQRQRV